MTAGAQVLQIFDSWAGSLPDDQFQRWVVAPTKVLVERVRARHPHVPIIGFPRGAGAQAAGYVSQTGVDGVGCDTAMPLALMAGPLADKAVVQGNLDPLLLVAGGEAMERQGCRNSDGSRGQALHLQSRPRHRAANAAGERGAAGGAGAQGMNMLSAARLAFPSPLVGRGLGVGGIAERQPSGIPPLPIPSPTRGRGHRWRGRSNRVTC